MKRHYAVSGGVMVFVLLGLLTACNMDIDAPKTPTVAVSPTLDETAIARLATPTTRHTVSPSPTRSLTPTPSPTPSLLPSATVSMSHTPTHMPTDTTTASSTPTATATQTSNPTLTPTASATATALPTQKPSPSFTRTPTLTITSTATAIPILPSPTLTPTASPSSTASPSPIPLPSFTPAIALLDVPTATPHASLTFTPFPTITPNQTATWDAQHVDPLQATPTITPGGIYTLVPTPTQLPTATFDASTQGGAGTVGEGTFYDPNAVSAGQDALPLAPAGQTGPAGPAMPEVSSIVVSYAGQIVPLLPLPGQIGTGAPLAQGNIFASGSGGEIASVGSDRWLYVNGQPVTVSPASQYGLHENLSFNALEWSQNGRFLAMRVDAADPYAFNGIDSGVWIYEPATGRSWQVLRNTYEGQMAQLGDQRRAISIQWAPNSTALVVQVETPLGRANVFMPVDHDVNQFINAIPYADAVWSSDSASLIVSGNKWGAGTVIGHVALDTNWTYTEYANQYSTGLIMQAATQLYNGQLAFFGGPTQDSFGLYIMQPIPGAQPTSISGAIYGQIESVEWNPERTSALITVQRGGNHQLWVVRIDGTMQDITPTGGQPNAAHWR